MKFDGWFKSLGSSALAPVRIYAKCEPNPAWRSPFRSGCDSFPFLFHYIYIFLKNLNKTPAACFSIHIPITVRIARTVEDEMRKKGKN